LQNFKSYFFITLSLFETLSLGMIYDAFEVRLHIDSFQYDFYHLYKTVSIRWKTCPRNG